MTWTKLSHALIMTVSILFFPVYCGAQTYKPGDTLQLPYARAYMKSVTDLNIRIVEKEANIDLVVFMISEAVQDVQMQFHYEVVYVQGLRNAVAAIKNGKRLIVIDRDWALEILDEFGLMAPLMTILAHEIGHHINGHTLTDIQAEKERQELEADRFSGFAMARALLYGFQTTMYLEKYKHANDQGDYPKAERRIREIRGAYNGECGRMRICGNRAHDRIDKAQAVFYQKIRIAASVRAYVARRQGEIQQENNGIWDANSQAKMDRAIQELARRGITDERGFPKR